MSSEFTNNMRDKATLRDFDGFTKKEASVGLHHGATDNQVKTKFLLKEAGRGSQTDRNTRIIKVNAKSEEND